MWAMAVLGAATLVWLVRWRRSGRPWGHDFEYQAMRLFTRLWHRAQEVTAPLPKTGPAILVAKHQSNADPAFLLATCHRPIRFLQAQEYFNVFLLRKLFELVGCIAVARNGKDGAALRLAFRYLREGDILCVFPEGDVRAVHSGRVRLKSGAALLALRSRAPVFTAFVAGAPQTGSVLGDWLVPSQGAQVRFGPPVDLRRYYDRPLRRKLLAEVTAELMRQVELLNPDRKQPAPWARRSA